MKSDNRDILPLNLLYGTDLLTSVESVTQSCLQDCHLSLGNRVEDADTETAMVYSQEGRQSKQASR